MGIIQKQSIKGAIYSYIGVALGFIITGILFPRLLSTNEVGLLRLLVSYSTLLAQFAVLGFNNVTVKLFTYFKDDDKKHHGFLGLALLVSTIGFIIAVTIYVGLHNYFVEHEQEKSSLFISYFYYVIPLTLFTLLFGILDTYYRVLYNAVIGIVYKEVFQRLFILISIILYYFKIIDFNTLVICYSVALITPAVLLLIALIKENRFFVKPDFDFINKSLAFEMLSVAFFGIIVSYSGVLVLNIDMVMIDHYLGLSNAGIYTITFFFGTLILVPMRSMGKIGSVIISEAWKKNDKKTIFDIYQKSSLTLGVLGMLLFIGIIGNMDNIFHIIGKNYESGRYVIVFISMANLSDVFFGISHHVIINSKYYRWLTILIFGVAVSVIVTNLIFIPIYGIVGAAIASFISKLIYNFSKYLFLLFKYKFQIFTFKHVLLLLAGIIAWLSTEYISPMHSYLLDIFIRSTIISFVYIVLIYWWKISEDINEKINKIVHFIIH